MAGAVDHSSHRVESPLDSLVLTMSDDVVTFGFLIHDTTLTPSFISEVAGICTATEISGKTS